jgi:uncharacterized OB-fold protein
VAAVPIHPGLFTLPGDPRGAHLLAGRCGGCGGLHFPAAETCPYCGGRSCATAAIGARGTLALYTVVNARPPGYRGPVPYGFGVVDLEDGMRVITRLGESRVERLRVGMPVALEVAPLFTNDDGDQVLSFAYTPVGEEPDARSRRPAAPSGGER